MKYTLVDKDNNKVLVNYLYKENLENLGENYFGATRRTQALYTKVYPEPMVAFEMDKYIDEQVKNSNHIKIASTQPDKKVINSILWVTILYYPPQAHHQGEDDNRQLHVYQDWHQPQRGHQTSSRNYPQPPWHFNPI